MDATASQIPPFSEECIRRLRRKISNRESARRSRMRKQRYLEDLRSRVGRLRHENSFLKSNLSTISGRCAAVLQDNKLLLAELATLRRRLSEIRRELFLRQIQRLASPASAGGGLASICRSWPV
ncbi:hypothetical protein HPP92_013579 [Vanilla planifolia]|uniref:BZIP domain-containing protein n=1 Tax=Vanilla planifolia TaxID=51239 RepID=A0A835R0I3_VANPL|nr:hypothetical protein HPP92_014018 [Vanilla planifolia]KAG0478860.1 hypothetical protein HPP92_013579 [Vanilla planifolia]